MKIPFDPIAREMGPVKDSSKTPTLNTTYDPLVKLKLPNKKVGLIFPNSLIPVDVNRVAVKRVDSIVIHIHGGGFVC